MAVVLENRCVGPEVYRMRLAQTPSTPGQFYMLRPLEGAGDPLLGRPISVFDCVEGDSVFLYKVVGRGTQLLSRKREGDEVATIGPLGNGFPLEDANLTLIGGGIGIAPLYYLLKEHGRLFPARKRRVYLGYSGESFLTEDFAALADACKVNIGGFVTEDVDFGLGGLYCACGPTPMLRAAKREAERCNTRLLLSLEARMACGVGACLGCSCETLLGNKRVCKDGPVFPAEEVLL